MPAFLFITASEVKRSQNTPNFQAGTPANIRNISTGANKETERLKQGERNQLKGLSAVSKTDLR